MKELGKMRKMSLIIVSICILDCFFIKGCKFDTHVKNTAQDQFSETNYTYHSSESETLFYDKGWKEIIDYWKEELGEINFYNLVERIDRKKAQYFFEDKKTNQQLNGLRDWKGYELLCLAKRSLSVEIQSKLKCRYVDRGIPFLKVAPFKEEEAYLEPRIVLFHNVLYEEEIETIKRIALPEMKRAVNSYEETEEESDFEYRITDIAWLDKNIHKHINTVNLRVELMTGLTLETAEPLQVAYYPLGGKYEPHYDFKTSSLQFTEYNTDHNERIATLLFYLSNVEKGGATVFPKLDVSLVPRKASAAFWYNFKPNGFRDYLTLHAACPVTSGSKWAANLWISEAWQEFFRPCTLDNQQRDEEWEQLCITT